MVFYKGGLSFVFLVLMAKQVASNLFGWISEMFEDDDDSDDDSDLEGMGGDHPLQPRLIRSRVCEIKNILNGDDDDDHKNAIYRIGVPGSSRYDVYVVSERSTIVRTIRSRVEGASSPFWHLHTQHNPMYTRCANAEHVHAITRRLLAKMNTSNESPRHVSIDVAATTSSPLINLQTQATMYQRAYTTDPRGPHQRVAETVSHGHTLSPLLERQTRQGRRTHRDPYLRFSDAGDDIWYNTSIDDEGARIPSASPPLPQPSSLSDSSSSSSVSYASSDDDDDDDEHRQTDMDTIAFDRILGQQPVSVDFSRAMFREVIEEYSRGNAGASREDAIRWYIDTIVTNSWLYLNGVLAVCSVYPILLQEDPTATHT